MPDPVPTKLHLRKTEGLDVEWSDGRHDFFSLSELRTNCPCATCREHRRTEQQRKSRLTILPGNFGGALVVTQAEPVGHYALRLHFSDGHASGIYSWAYLRSLR